MIRDTNVRFFHVIGALISLAAVDYYNRKEAINKFGKENIVQYGTTYAIRVDAGSSKRTNE